MELDVLKLMCGAGGAGGGDKAGGKDGVVDVMVVVVVVVVVVVKGESTEWSLLGRVFAARSGGETAVVYLL